MKDYRLSNRSHNTSDGLAYISVQNRSHIGFIDLPIEFWVTSGMTADHEFRQEFILNRDDGILYDAQYIESGQNRLSQFDVLLEWNCRIVSASQRVCRRDD